MRPVDILNEYMINMDIPIRVTSTVLRGYQAGTDVGEDITREMIDGLVRRINTAIEQDGYDGQGFRWGLSVTTDVSRDGTPTRVFLTRSVAPHPLCPMPAAASSDSLAARLRWKESLANIADDLHYAGWDISYQYDKTGHKGRALRVEGTHPDGAAVLVSVDHAGPARYYVYHPDWDHWGVGNRALAKRLISDLGDDIAPEITKFIHGTNCACGKRYGHPTRKKAHANLLEVTPWWSSKNAKAGKKRPQSVYRCTADARMWHLTSKPQERQYAGDWASL